MTLIIKYEKTDKKQNKLKNKLTLPTKVILPKNIKKLLDSTPTPKPPPLKVIKPSRDVEEIRSPRKPAREDVGLPPKKTTVEQDDAQRTVVRIRGPGRIIKSPIDIQTLYEHLKTKGFRSKYLTLKSYEGTQWIEYLCPIEDDTQNFRTMWKFGRIVNGYNVHLEKKGIVRIMGEEFVCYVVHGDPVANSGPAPRMRITSSDEVEQAGTVLDVEGFFSERFDAIINGNPLNQGTYISVMPAYNEALKLVDWACKNFSSTELNPYSADDLHTTIIYSKTPVKDYPLLGVLRGGNGTWATAQPIGLEVFGTTLVLLLSSPWLAERNAVAQRCGGTSDFPTYRPHISLGEIIELDSESAAATRAKIARINSEYAAQTTVYAYTDVIQYLYEAARPLDSNWVANFARRSLFSNKQQVNTEVTSSEELVTRFYHPSPKYVSTNVYPETYTVLPVIAVQMDKLRPDEYLPAVTTYLLGLQLVQQTYMEDGSMWFEGNLVEKSMIATFLSTLFFGENRAKLVLSKNNRLAYSQSLATVGVYATWSAAQDAAKAWQPKLTRLATMIQTPLDVGVVQSAFPELLIGAM